MRMELSRFGRKYLNDTGVLSLMEDLGNAVQQEGVLMLGGGNPSHIPQVEEILCERMGYMLDGTGEFEALIGNYDGPSGNQAFIEALVALFREEHLRRGTVGSGPGGSRYEEQDPGRRYPVALRQQHP